MGGGGGVRERVSDDRKPVRVGGGGEARGECLTIENLYAVAREF